MASEATIGTLVDSNVLLDIVTADPTWAPWSERRLVDALDVGRVVVNPIGCAHFPTSISARTRRSQVTGC